MKELEELKRETESDLNAARERRLDRQARERRNGPILDALDRMSRGEPVEHTPGPRHQPQLESVPARRDCTCLGSCKGAAGLAPGWQCALNARAEAKP